MSTPDFTGLTKPQLEALSSVAFGGGGAFCNPRTMKVLEKRRLVTPTTLTLGGDRFGPIRVKAWDMPLPVHMRFCEWCAENIPDPDDG